MEEYDLRQFNEADIPQIVALLKEVGWNNKAHDRQVRMFLKTNPQCCIGAVTKSGTLVATTAGTISDDRKCGYLALVIVTAAHRRKGLCEVLIRKAHEILISQGTALIGLDASAMGFPIYKRIGYIDPNIVDSPYIAANFATAISHFTGSELDEANAIVLLAGPHERTAIACSDKIAFGADRSTLIKDNYIFPLGFFIPAATESGQCAEGLLCRQGALSLQIGPIFAHSEHSLRLLIAALCLAAPKSLMAGAEVVIPDTAASYSSNTFIDLGFEVKPGPSIRRMLFPVAPSGITTQPLPPFYCAVMGNDLG
ncbi:hypothetical protein Pelo_7857 [Pelomyxa schiedti]|nr:hypothetical protein Pelo_7857 [Pelomyxa schiedti]